VTKLSRLKGETELPLHMLPLCCCSLKTGSFRCLRCTLHNGLAEDYHDSITDVALP
jgi:hypothetical protein